MDLVPCFLFVFVLVVGISDLLIAVDCKVRMELLAYENSLRLVNLLGGSNKIADGVDPQVFAIDYQIFLKAKTQSLEQSNRARILRHCNSK